MQVTRQVAQGIADAALIVGVELGSRVGHSLILPAAVAQAGTLRGPWTIGYGHKRSHWIWFVLPQLAGLGRSAMAQRYGIADLDKARAYLADPVLRQRLEAVIGVIDEQLRKLGQSLEHLMGSGLDAAKTVSSLTPYEAAGLDSGGALLDQIGRRCERTLERLS